MHIVSLSALQQYLYCPRRCGLIYVEQVWEDNVYTERGNRHHEHVDTVHYEQRPGVRMEYALPLWSDTLGLSGRGDMVEFDAEGTPCPVEHKVGRKVWLGDTIQLCAQALCLEEMFQRPVLVGALYYKGLSSRKEIKLDKALRHKTLDTIQQVRTLLENMQVPKPIYTDICPSCSLFDICLPEASTIYTLQDDI